MKHLIKYNESNNFLHLKEVIQTLKDMSVDLLDEGISFSFGTYDKLGTFKSQFSDISIKMATLGKLEIYISYDLNNLNDKQRKLMSSTILSVLSYLENEDFRIRMTATAFAPSKFGLEPMPYFFNINRDSLQVDIENGTIKQIKIFFSLY